jgi:hypothetical protein
LSDRRDARLMVCSSVHGADSIGSGRQTIGNSCRKNSTLRGVIQALTIFIRIWIIQASIKVTLKKANCFGSVGVV